MSATAAPAALPDLLPCPFCGGEAEVLGTERSGSWSVRCSGHMGGDCPARAQTRWCDYLTAVALWNTRAGAPGQQAGSLAGTRDIASPRRPHARWTKGFITRLARLVSREVRADLELTREVMSEAVHQLVYGNRGASSRVLASVCGEVRAENGRAWVRLPVAGQPSFVSVDAGTWVMDETVRQHAAGALDDRQPVRITISVEQSVTLGNQVEDFDGVFDPEGLDNTVSAREVERG